MPKASFAEFQVGAPKLFIVNIERLLTGFPKELNDMRVTLSLEEHRTKPAGPASLPETITQTVHLTFSNGYEKVMTVPVPEDQPDATEEKVMDWMGGKKVATYKTTTSSTIITRVLKSICEEVGRLDTDDVWFRANKESLEIFPKVEGVEMAWTFSVDHEHSVLASHTAENPEQLVNMKLGYMTSYTEALNRVCDLTEIAFATNQPMTLRGKPDERFILEYILAPRIHEEAQH
jgi:hypothetical protein